jgi:rod shape-determining protein MreB
MFKSFRGLFSNDLSIDLGTANTLIYVRGQGIVLNEPSVVAIRQDRGPGGPRSVAAVGAEAKRMLGRTPGNIVTVRPLKDGVIADFSMTEEMLKQFIRKVHRSRMFRPSPRVLVCVPCGSTQVERRAIKSPPNRQERARRVPDRGTDGRRDRAGIPVHEARGRWCSTIGGGTPEVAVISLNGIVYSASVRIGGDRFDEAIINYVRRNHGTLIGESTAERINKMEIGCAFSQTEVREIEISGRNLAEGVPRMFTINRTRSSKRCTNRWPASSRGALGARTDAAGTVSDVAERGIVLTGGGAPLRDIDRPDCPETGLHVHVADDPLTCVASAAAARSSWSISMAGFLYGRELRAGARDEGRGTMWCEFVLGASARTWPQAGMTLMVRAFPRCSLRSTDRQRWFRAAGAPPAAHTASSDRARRGPRRPAAPSPSPLALAPSSTMSIARNDSSPLFADSALGHAEAGCYLAAAVMLMRLDHRGDYPRTSARR